MFEHRNCYQQSSCCLTDLPVVNAKINKNVCLAEIGSSGTPWGWDDKEQDIYWTEWEDKFCSAQHREKPGESKHKCSNVLLDYTGWD